ncbi:MAG TPA: ABC transporter ATP-binding protein [Vicinamibacterales bacterium]|nr:ABC transporter ATP-binding protein [Vicinamibacterales bacterium]
MLDVDFTFSYRRGPVLECAWRHDPSEAPVTVLLGPSGSGKTTLLRCLAGLERPTRGHIRLDAEVWFDAARGIQVPPDRRNVGLLFQDYALFPHMTVEENIAFGIRSLPVPERRARVRELIEMLHLTGLESRRPRQLSGGQQQRVALARAVARQPSLLLLDEPLAALDPVTRDDVRADLQELIRRLAVPTYVVSHDRNDALALADRTMLLEHGRIVQSGPTEQVFAEPATPLAARLVGIDTVLFGRVVERTGGLITAVVEGRRVRAEAPSAASHDVALCIRAEDVVVASTHAGLDVSAINRWPAIVRHSRPEGAFVRVVLDCGFRLSALVTRAGWEHLHLAPGDHAVAMVKAASIRVLPRH